MVAPHMETRKKQRAQRLLQSGRDAVGDKKPVKPETNLMNSRGLPFYTILFKI